MRRLGLLGVLGFALSGMPARASGPAAEGKPAKKPEQGDSAEDPKAGKRSVRERTQGNVGLGVLLGNPLALSLKVFVRPKHAFSFGAGYGWLMRPGEPPPKGTWRLHIDYAWHPGAIASNQVMDLIPYLGIGVGSGFFIARVPPPEGGTPHVRARPISFLRLPVLGLAFHWQRVPMDTVIEAAWTSSLIWLPAPHGDLRFVDFGIGIRYYF